MPRSKSKPARTRNQPTSKAPTNHIVSQQTFHQGPIPDPRTLAAYNQIVPNAAERIISMAESETLHRQALERDTLEFNKSDRMSARAEIKIGQILSFLLCTIVVGCGTFVAISGNAWPGVALSITGLSGIIAAYLRK